MTKNIPGHLVTLYNERNASIRGHLQGGWHRLFLRGTMCVTGFGDYAERAELNGLAYYNTSFGGTRTQYADPHSKFLAGKDSYLILTCERTSGRMRVEMKSLQGEVLDRQIFPKPARGKIKP
ncbi:MAG: hypothetical protein P1V19_08350 [Gimesia sp.]|nr:hypothetical protein [Gimesia sp.]